MRSVPRSVASSLGATNGHKVTPEPSTCSRPPTPPAPKGVPRAVYPLVAPPRRPRTSCPGGWRDQEPLDHLAEFAPPPPPCPKRRERTYGRGVATVSTGSKRLGLRYFNSSALGQDPASEYAAGHPEVHLSGGSVPSRFRPWRRPAFARLHVHRQRRAPTFWPPALRRRGGEVFQRRLRPALSAPEIAALLEKILGRVSRRRHPVRPGG